MTQTLFANARVFDGTGSAPVAMDVRVEGKRIVAVEAPGTEAGVARVVDGSAAR